MKIEYDKEHDILNIEVLEDVETEESEEQEGIIVDFSRDKKIVSIEILDAGKRFSEEVISSLQNAVKEDKAVTV